MWNYSPLPSWFVNPHFAHFLGAIWGWPLTATKELAINPHFVDFVWCNMRIVHWIQRKLLKAEIQSLYRSLLCAQHTYTHKHTHTHTHTSTHTHTYTHKHAHTHMHKHKHWNTWNRWFMRIIQWKQNFFLPAWLLLGTLLLMFFMERKADHPFLNASWYCYQFYSEVFGYRYKISSKKDAQWCTFESYF